MSTRSEVVDPMMPRRAGFRLSRFEVLNWGTFHHRIWKIEPSGENALLTGDIGSGKSTLVDAITTLLVPPRKITYNRAAGAESKERSLYSYVRGEFRSVSNELTGSAQAQALRDESSYSVILALFTDAAAQRNVTLATVFWTREGERVPARFYVVAPATISIAGQFTDFGTDIQNLRKRLRSEKGLKLHDSFEEYSAHMRRELGVPHAQALELFYQTVSMKSVGNLTEFVRHHMLERDDTEDRIRALISNFENLNRAHDAVLRARDQIAMLDPLVAAGEKLESLEQATAERRRARDTLGAWFAQHRIRLIDQAVERLGFEQNKAQQQLETHKAEVDRLTRERTRIEMALERQGGGRIRELEQAVRLAEAERDRQRDADEQYRRLCANLDLRPGTTLESFLGTLRTAGERRVQVEADKQRLDREAVDKGIEFVTSSDQEKQLGEEIRALEGRESNIPIANLHVRESLAQALGVEPDELPFVGELLRVRPDEAQWEGAIERLLHSFALTLLVPEGLYSQVSRYVDRTHLRGRLVYLRVRDAPGRPVPLRAAALNAAARKLDIKPDSAFYGFLKRELAEQFDHACCDSLEEFQRLPRALTRNGQIKSNERRHDKDDRRSIDDRSRYVLGWDNRAKLKVLRSDRAELQRRLVAINQAREKITRSRNEQDQRLRAADSLLDLKDFNRIDWRGTAAAIQKLLDEKKALEQSDDALRTLREQLAQVEEDYSAADLRRDEATRRVGAVQDRIKQLLEDRGAAALEQQSISETDLTENAPLLQELCAQVLGEHTLELRSLQSQQKSVREALQARIDADDKAASRLRENVVGQMQRYKAAYAVETVEMDASTEALADYRRQLRGLKDDDLPRFEARFKELLNRETINNMAAFQAHLQRRRHGIEERIDIINSSLTSIEYDRTHGTYIELVSQPTTDADVRNFQSDLRECISGGDERGELYTEQKFLEVKALVERLNGREGQTELDARWCAKVTDVRNWFEFAAKERWRADGTERELFRDSSGKSGGQKEKLAYTILAAALAYQFGLGDTQSRQRHFRFVVIDEAFGRGSDESTRYGLELFRTLDLQLLIVTPLQKIAVIEDYIAAVHFVHNEGGSDSRVQTLTIEEFRERRDEYLLHSVNASA